MSRKIVFRVDILPLGETTAEMLEAVEGTFLLVVETLGALETWVSLTLDQTPIATPMLVSAGSEHEITLA